MNTTSYPQQPFEVGYRLAIAAGTALFVAGVLLVTCVLPAEYAVDPLGVGARLGLLELGVVGQQVDALEAGRTGSSEVAVAQVITHQKVPFRQETVTFELAPREGMEYKYRLAKGDALLYSWKAPVTVNYEAHAEPDGAPRGYAQSYEKTTGQQDSGTLTAPFAGIHGWYWENTTDQPITVTLTTAGNYNVAHEFRTGHAVKNRMFQ